jgi:hypothetical protein
MQSQIELRANCSGPLLRPTKRTPATPVFPVSKQVEPAGEAHEPKAEAREDRVAKSNKKTETILIWCGIVLLLINVAGTWVSFRAANAAEDRANETNRLTRQLLRGTSAAHIVSTVVSQDIRPDNRQVRIGFRNDGKVNALNVQGDATVCLLSFPSEEKIACKTMPVSKSQLGFEGDQLTLDFDGIVGDGAVTLLESNRATVQYSTKLRFNDGFDDWIDESSCQLYFVRHFLISDRVQERNWANCDAGRTILAAEFKRRVEE